MKGIVLSLIALLGALTFSCSKQQDLVTPNPGVTKLGQNANENLVNTMAADTLVRNHILADVRFANDYTVWYNNLATAQREARDAEVNSAIENGTDINDPVHSTTEINAYNTLQHSRAEQIKEKYTQLSQFSENEYVTVQSDLFNTVTNSLLSQDMSATN